MSLECVAQRKSVQTIFLTEYSGHFASKESLSNKLSSTLEKATTIVFLFCLSFLFKLKDSIWKWRKGNISFCKFFQLFKKIVLKITLDLMFWPSFRNRLQLLYEKTKESNDALLHLNRLYFSFKCVESWCHTSIFCKLVGK